MSKSMAGAAEAEPAQGTAMHYRCLMVGLLIMVAGSVYPLLFTSANGRADHGLAMALFWAMSAGLVRGVGFVPRAWGWKLLFSAWSCGVTLGLAAYLRWSP
jgi:predicted membrane protein